ncbi:hypothetical protein ACC674_38155, partial [Rhizobium ruizarguesonis]
TFDLDDLLADVSRYPVPQRANPAPFTPPPASVEAAPVPAALAADAPVHTEVIAPPPVAVATAPVRPAGEQAPASQAAARARTARRN